MDTQDSRNSVVSVQGETGVGALDEERRKLHEQPLWKVRIQLALKAFSANWKLFAENKIGLLGLGIILFFALFALAHPIMMTYVWETSVYHPIRGFDGMVAPHPSPPSERHWLGTDPMGRDILSQLMYSTRAAFVLGAVAALVTVLFGTTVGAISAYFGGWVDTFFMRLADIIITLPTIVLLIVLSALFDMNLFSLAIVLGIVFGFGATTIILKSQALTITVRTYVDAARVAGGSRWHIIFRHIVPNLLPLSFLYMMFTVTDAIFTESVLSFFGLIDVGMSWGLMINTASVTGYLLNFETWWLMFPTGLSITLLCAAFYLVGRALDEVINPRLRKR
ncbi:MAG: ABC transporter permease [Chloroflexota bacterium]